MMARHGFRRAKAIFSGLLVVALCGGLFGGCAFSAGDAGLGVEASAPAPVAETSLPQELVDPGERPKLEIIYDGMMSGIDNEDGFFMVDVPQSDLYQNLMYYDYKTLQQRYFCSEAGCTHDHAGCTSFLDTYGGVNPFSYGGHLYINYAMYNDGTEDRNQWPSALVRYSAEGRDAEVLLTYPSCEFQVSRVYADGEAFYFSAPDGFVRYELESGEKTVVWRSTPPSYDEEYSNVEFIYDIYDDGLLLLQETWSGKGRTLEFEAKLSLLCVQTGEVTPLHTFPPGQPFPYSFNPEGIGYYIEPESGEVRCFDLTTKEDKLVTDMLCPYAYSEVRENPGPQEGEVEEELFHYAQSWGLYQYGEWLVFNVWVPNWIPTAPAGSEREDITLSYNLLTGESTEITFGSFFNGYVHPLQVWGQTPYGLLVTEEHHKRMIHTTGTGGEPYSFESEYWVFALISLEDYIHSEPNFKTIASVEYSGAF